MSDLSQSIKEYGLNWKSKFTERELHEIEFCQVYADKFAHGTDGHTIRIIVAKMASMLDDEELVAPDVEPTMPIRPETAN